VPYVLKCAVDHVGCNRFSFFFEWSLYIENFLQFFSQGRFAFSFFVVSVEVIIYEEGWRFIFSPSIHICDKFTWISADAAGLLPCCAILRGFTKARSCCFFCSVLIFRGGGRPIFWPFSRLFWKWSKKMSEKNEKIFKKKVSLGLEWNFFMCSCDVLQNFFIWAIIDEHSVCAFFGVREVRHTLNECNVFSLHILFR